MPLKRVRVWLPLSSPNLIVIFSETISNFLSTFASKDTELTRGFADIGLNDDDDAPTRTKSLKYMQQLVRVYTLFTRPILLTSC